MAEHEISVLIGGRAGDGISSAGQVIARLLAQNGYRVHMYFDYPSLIKGGHNFAIIRAAEKCIGAVRHKVDFILALNQETITLHRERLGEQEVPCIAGRDLLDVPLFAETDHVLVQDDLHLQ